MLQEPRLPAVQAVRTQGKQTRKQQTLIRGRALAIPTEISYDLQSHQMHLISAFQQPPFPGKGKASENQALLQAASTGERSQQLTPPAHDDFRVSFDKGTEKARQEAR